MSQQQVTIVIKNGEKGSLTEALARFTDGSEHALDVNVTSLWYLLMRRKELNRYPDHVTIMMSPDEFTNIVIRCNGNPSQKPLMMLRGLV